MTGDKMEQEKEDSGHTSNPDPRKTSDEPDPNREKESDAEIEDGDRDETSSPDHGHDLGTPSETGHNKEKERDNGDSSPPDPDDPDTPDVEEMDFQEVRMYLFNFACTFYVSMGLVGFFILYARGGEHWLLPAEAEAPAGYLVMIGALIAGGVVLGGWILRHFSSYAREFEREFAPLVNAFGYMQIPMIAFLSGVGEELFFRGALLDWTGLWISSIAFGLMHFPWNKKMIPWPFFAFFLGLLFGYLVLTYNSLYAPIAAHILINMMNLYLIKYNYPMSAEDVLDFLMNSDSA